MDIEADLLRARAPRLVTEAVDMFAVGRRVEAMIARGDALVVYFVDVVWSDDLLCNRGQESAKLDAHCEDGGERGSEWGESW